MDNISLSQTVPISELPKDYLSLIRLSEKRNEPVILLRHSKPVAALVAQKVLNQLMVLKRKLEEARALQSVKEGDEEFLRGKTVTRLPK